MIAWQNFYILVGTAAATLIGLMFVAITFSHFVQVLLTSCFMLVPSMGATLLGVLLAAVAIFRIGALARVHRHMRAGQQRNNDLELSDWVQGIVIPLAMHLLLVASAALFIVGWNALVLVAVVTIVTLLNGIYGAWELVVWIALTRSQK